MKVGFAPARGMHQCMSVLVGIPTHKRPDLLRQCLDSIAAQEGDLPPVRVFVADNDAKGQEGSRLAQEVAAGYRFPISSTVVAEPGISAVRNAILDEARREGDEFIAMIDDDETASPQWLSELLRVQAEYGADVVGGPVEPRFAVQPSKLALDYWVRAPVPEGRCKDIYGTGNCLVATSLLSRLDWPQFDLAFGLTGGGDTEWFERLAALGAISAWSPRSITSETVPAERSTDAWVIRRTFRYSTTGARILVLHRKWRKLTPLVGWAIRDLALSPLILLRHGRDKAKIRVARAVGHLAGVFGITYGEYSDLHSPAAGDRAGQ
jgi:succinoglycan biosynthesis protein ExoM